MGLGETATVPYEARKVILRVEWIDYNNLLDEIQVVSIEPKKEEPKRSGAPVSKNVNVRKGASSTQVSITGNTICIIDWKDGILTQMMK